MLVVASGRLLCLSEEPTKAAIVYTYLHAVLGVHRCSREIICLVSFFCLSLMFSLSLSLPSLQVDVWSIGITCIELGMYQYTILCVDNVYMLLYRM